MKRNSILLGIILMVVFIMPLGINAEDVAKSVTQTLNMTVDGSALLAVTQGTNGGTTVNLSLTGAIEAGAAIDSVASNNKTRLRISSLVESGKTRHVSASIPNDLSSTGTKLSVNLIPQDNFQPAKVNAGTSAGKKELTTSDITLVSGITTCWSGTSANDGYIIEYTYEKKTGATYLQSTSGLLVTFTISTQE